MIRYYNGNVENYEKNVNTYIKKSNDLIYTNYYLNEEEKEKKKNKIRMMKKKKRKRKRRKKTQEELDKEMWEYKREGEKISNYFKEKRDEAKNDIKNLFIRMISQIL